MRQPAVGNGGFTLIELLVALAVLLILIVAFGAYYLAGRPHARLASAANDLVSDIRLVRGEAVKRGSAAVCSTGNPGVMAIRFTSTTRYQVGCDETPLAAPLEEFLFQTPTRPLGLTRNYVPTAGEMGESGEYDNNMVSFNALPANMFACSSGMVNTAAPANSGSCVSAATVAIQLTHADVDVWTAGNQPETRTVCVTSSGAVTCWRASLAALGSCDAPAAGTLRC